MSRKRRQSRRLRVAVVTGTRAEYGLLQSTLAAIDAHARLESQLVVTGMHLLHAFGRTVNQIVKDGRPIAARVPMQRGDDSPTDQAQGLSRGVAGIARYLNEADSDVVLVLGDRIEALAGALAAVTTGRVLAHIHGGDVAEGDFDDALRHAITKLAHVHLTATRGATRRVLRLGEDASRVHCVGAPGLDRLREIIAEVGPRRGRSGRVLVVQHAYGRAARVEERVTRAVLQAAVDCGVRSTTGGGCATSAGGLTVIYPNTDRGHAGVVRAIECFCGRQGRDDVRVHRSLSRDEYLRELLAADVLVGNSSSGVIEAPFAGTPSVDVGARQAGRELGGRSVIHAEERTEAICTAILSALDRRPRRGGASVYGDGRAGERIAEVLAEIQPGSALLRKRIAY